MLCSLFEIHIATHASLQYAEHVRQVCKRAATECAKPPKSGLPAALLDHRL